MVSDRNGIWLNLLQCINKNWSNSKRDVGSNLKNRTFNQMNLLQIYYEFNLIE